MIDPSAQTKFVQFLRSKVTAVISTISPEGQPMSATIYFTTGANYSFYFMTKSFTRKYNNLQKNNKASLVIGTENIPATVQIQGKVERIVDKAEFDLRLGELQKIFLNNDEFVAPMFQLAPEKNELVVYKLTPTWIRWLDLREENVDGDFVQIL